MIRLGIIAGQYTNRLTLRLISFLGNSIRAHAVCVTDVEINNPSQGNHRYTVMIVRKTPTLWVDHLILYIVRALAARGRITLFER